MASPLTSAGGRSSGVRGAIACDVVPAPEAAPAVTPGAGRTAETISGMSGWTAVRRQRRGS